MATGQRRARPRPAAADVAGPPQATPSARRPADLLAGTALSALVASGLFAFASPGWAQVSGVTGGTVVAGQATIRNNVPGQVTVTQSTARGVIDWRSFSIATGERVDFIQPGASSVTLNRVTGPDPSVIAGQMNANGQLILVNGAGVVFANGAQINAAGLVASTSNVSDTQRFMQGGTVTFDRPSANANASVSNAGTISVREGGLVGLAGHTASNSGTINARMGRVTIAGAETFTVDLAGDGLINFQVGNPVSRQPLDAQGNKRPLAANTGTINADGGAVTLTARAARGVVDSVVNAGGTINARAVREEGGVVVFGADDGTLNVTGTVNVSAAGKGQRGGQVVATAARGNVNVTSTARIDASGGSGGGTVLIGGGKQGQGPLANATNTNVAKGATIRADASERGNGGTVIVWADNATVFGGSISATGGPQGGDGGFVEVSGKSYLDFTGQVDLRSSGGVVGTLLLDPSDITIQNGGTDDTTETGGDPNTITGKSGTSILRVSVLEAALAKANVVVDASGGPGAGSGSITLSDNVSSDFGGLTLKAITDITLNANIRLGSGNGTGVLSLISSKGNVAGSGGAIRAKAVVLDIAGNVTLTNTSNTFAELVGTVGGTLTALSANSLTVGASPTTGSSGLTATGALAVTTSGGSSNLAVGGAVAGGGVTLVAGNDLSGAGTIAAGAGGVALTAAGNGGINLSGTITGKGLTAAAGSGGVTLSSADNAFGSFQNTGTIGGNIAVVHKGDLTVNTTKAGGNAAAFTTNTSGNISVVGPVSATGVTLTAAGNLTGAGAIGAGALALTAGGSGGINLTGILTGASLTATAGSGGVSLSNVDNAFGSFAAVGTVGGAISVVHKGNLTINATDAGANAVAFTTNTAGDITVAGALSGKGITLSAAGNLLGSGTIGAGAGGLILSAGASGGINLTGTITGTGLTAGSTAGGVTLSNVDNAFGSWSSVGTIGGSVDVVHKGALSVNSTL
ncbi:MAG TPA: filamentous hemagglutinin N-terminal domain-containing protein, partial [Vineibacter sp.]|nr:filamentous hemagglutinin N-terminal domain-containing protein [Vineibacter sp.]